MRFNRIPISPPNVIVGVEPEGKHHRLMSIQPDPEGNLSYLTYYRTESGKKHWYRVTANVQAWEETKKNLSTKTPTKYLGEKD